MTDKLILLDIGGTFIKCSDGREVPIDSNGSAESMIASFKEAVGDATKVSAAAPGPFDYKTGTFLMTHKFAALYGMNFADLVGLPRENCTYIHDVNCMLLGEMCEGEAKDYGNVAIVALGTGLGFAMCINREIMTNELGSPAVSIFKRPFRDGILEDYASKRGFINGYKRHKMNAGSGQTAEDAAGLPNVSDAQSVKDAAGLPNVPDAQSVKDAAGLPNVFDAQSVKDIADLAKKGDKAAKDTFTEGGAIIADAIAPILEEYGIECLLFGGQISRSFSLFENAVREGLSKVSTLKKITTISDFGNATFRGLRHNI